MFLALKTFVPTNFGNSFLYIIVTNFDVIMILRSR